MTGHHGVDSDTLIRLANLGIVDAWPSAITEMAAAGIDDPWQITGPRFLATTADRLAFLSGNFPDVETVFDLLATGWTWRHVPDLPPGMWVTRWDRLTVAYADGIEPGTPARYNDPPDWRYATVPDLRIELALQTLRRESLRYLRERVVEVVDDLKLDGRSQYLYPAKVPV